MTVVAGLPTEPLHRPKVSRLASETFGPRLHRGRETRAERGTDHELRELHEWIKIKYIRVIRIIRGLLSSSSLCSWCPWWFNKYSIKAI